MLLKNYQRAALDKLEKFLCEAQLRGAAQAFKQVAPQGDNPYATAEYKPPQGIADCPHVCLRLPTGGGKTLLAAHSIAKVARYQSREFPVVLWMTPSNTIRRQTVEALKNHAHPYRKAMDADFGGQVEIWDIEQWQHIRPQDMTARVCVVVTTIQALRIGDTGKRNVYAHNENLEPHFKQFPHAGLELEKDGAGRVKFSFANLLHIHRPLVIVDEAHNAVSELSAELHRRLRPSCIIEFTATPRDKAGKQMHNVLVNVAATVLRDEEMIKLPIELVEHDAWDRAVNGAILNREQLAKIAREENEKIRPLVLYQAQDKSGEVTVDVLREYLVKDENIAPKKIAVATGEQRELDDIDINHPQCPVEHVITVQALKEGWDCPFAYVLCSVANVQSAASVEQLLGRVMRMPFARRRNHAKLNRAYAHVPKTKFANAAHALCDKLVTKMGFDKDEADQAVQPALMDLPDDVGKTAPTPEVLTLTFAPDFSAFTEEERREVEQAVQVLPQEDGTTRVVVESAIAPAAVEVIAAGAKDEDEVEEFRSRLVRKNALFQQYASPARRGVKFGALPKLYFMFGERELEASPEKIESTLNWKLLEQDFLLRPEEFSVKDTAEGYEINFGRDEPMRLTVQELPEEWQPAFSNQSQQWSERDLALWLERKIRTGYLAQPVLAEFAWRNVQALLERGHQLDQLGRFKFALKMKLQDKLAQLRREAVKTNYQTRMFGDAPPLCKWEFTFDRDRLHYEYNTKYAGPRVFKKHYYDVVGDLKVKGEEHTCACALDKMSEVRHWIRNVDRKRHSFSLPLSDNNFYPDFIAELTDGRMLAVEYKGAQYMTGDDAKRKRLIGELWENLSEGKALFIMPSQNKDAPEIAEQIKAKLRQ